MIKGFAVAPMHYTQKLLADGVSAYHLDALAHCAQSNFLENFIYWTVSPRAFLSFCSGQSFILFTFMYLPVCGRKKRQTAPVHHRDKQRRLGNPNELATFLY